MARHIRLRDLVFGIEGLAISRNLFDGDMDFVRARVEEIGSLASRLDEAPLSLGMDVAELDPVEGYAGWSESYDSGGNPLIETEEPVVRSILDRLDPGAALDAACGTGRHGAYLTALGHRVVGVDQSEHMLAVARSKTADIEYRTGTLTALPIGDSEMDLAVCSLALTHVTDLGPAITELARVVRPGGRVVLSDIHPGLVMVTGQALFPTPDGRIAYVRNHHHAVGEYLAAFRAARLEVLDCQEPRYGKIPPNQFTAMIPEAAEAAWDGLPAALVWDLMVA